MTSIKTFVCLVAFIALAVFSIANVSATFGEIVDLEVKGIDVLDQPRPVSVSAGENFPVRVEFAASANAEDVRVKAWISGESQFTSVSNRLIVFEDNTYTWLVSVQVPQDLDDISETLELNVVVENRNDGTAWEVPVKLTLQRESYVFEILDVDMPNGIIAGDLLPVDVVLKNLGAQFADDTFVRIRIDALGIQDRAFFGDLASIDEPFSRNPFEADIPNGFERIDKDDTAERRLFLRIPSEAKSGIYVVEIEAFNDDASTTLTRKVAITGAEDSTMVISPVHSKTFNVGEQGEYSLTIVNAGNKIGVFEIVVESIEGLDITVSDPVIAVPAGSSMTVKLQAEADETGQYNFAVNVHSGGELVKRESFSANVLSNGVSAANPTVLLTVVLAIIFIVLLIVLIVLLTRRTDKTDESGEGYY